MNQNLIRKTAVAMSLLMFATALFPVASAQAPTLELEIGSVTDVKPEIDFPDVDVKLIYTLDNAGQSLASNAVASTPVTLTTSCDSGVTLTGPGVKLVSIPSAGQTTTTTTAKFTLGVTRQAPGLTSLSCTVQGQAAEAAPQGIPQSNSVTQPFIVAAAYYGAMQVKLDQALQQAGPQKDVLYNMELTNFGNAKTTVLFSLGSKPEGERWQQILPPPVIVDTATTGANNKETATFQVSTPYKTGWNNEIGTYQIVLNTEAFDDPEQKGNTMTADVLVRVRGVYVPGFEAVALVGSLLGAVLVIRRRQEE